MKYFVSLEKDAYHDWQAELLIESFNNIALIDDLYMTTNVTEKNRYPHLLNLLKHQNLFTFDDVGEMKGFRPINELYQLTTLIMDKAVSFPLVVMKPHVVIKEKIEKIVEIVGYKGLIEWDLSKPDGAPRKLMSSERLNHLGWQPMTPLEKGLAKAYQDFLANSAK